MPKQITVAADFQTERPHITIEGVKYKLPQGAVLMAHRLWKSREEWFSTEQLRATTGVKTSALRYYVKKINAVFQLYGWTVKGHNTGGYSLIPYKIVIGKDRYCHCTLCGWQGRRIIIHKSRCPKCRKATVIENESYEEKRDASRDQSLHSV